MRPATGATLLLVLPFALLASSPALVSAQAVTGRTVIEALEFEPLVFEQPSADRHEVDGIEILLLEDHTLPLVSVYAYFRGGYGLFAREDYAVAMGLPSMLRYGGTTRLEAEVVDETLEYFAIQASFGSAGSSITSTINSLAEHLGSALDLWGDMLTSPRFDEAEIDAWKGQQLESVLRRTDDPARLAFSEFNRLMYGDHPIGWEFESEDFAPDRVTRERFLDVHSRIVCRENLVLGVTGDVSWSEAEPLMRALTDRLAPCATTLPEAPIPDVRRGGGVFVIDRELEQAVIVMAHATDVRLSDDAAFYSATIGNSILGAGGFSSRILARVRTEEGYAYSASSVWTMPRRHEGILGAITRTRPESAIPAIEVILESMAEMKEAPPTEEELSTTVDQIVNGFVFNFGTASQIVSRSMFYLAQDLPDDWLERYLRGVQSVTPASIQRAFLENLNPDEMTILIVGDVDRIGREALAAFGPVSELEVR